MSLGLWDEPLAPDEREALLDRITEAVRRRGLQTPVLFALEIHRPVTFLASQALIVLGPLLGPLIGIEGMQNFSRLLREPRVVDTLIERIESTVTAQPQTSLGKDQEQE